MADQKGFQQKAQATDTDVGALETQSIPLVDLEYETITFRDCPEGKMPELPVGFFVPNEAGQVERLRSFRVSPGISKGKFAFELGKLEEAAGQNAKNVPKIITQFFGGNRTCPPAIESIGNIPLAEVAKRMSVSTQKLFENAYLADIATMIFGVRMAARKGRTVAINAPCPVTGCGETNRDDTHTLDEIECKNIPASVLKDKPLFDLRLPNPISDGKSKITHLYCQPLRFYQIALFAGSGKPPDFQILQACIRYIPESSIYGGRTTPFDENLYYELDEENMDACREMIQKLAGPGPGPVANIRYTCACGQQELDFPIPWARNPREFIYFMSKQITEED